MRLFHNGQAALIGFEKIDWDSFPNLKVVGCNATSTEHIDEECTKRGIKIISLKGETEFLKGISSTAEHTIGLIIALMRNYKRSFIDSCQKRNFYKGHTIRDKVLGIIGYGRVGRQVEQIAHGFQMTTIAMDITSNEDQIKLLFDTSDIITLHIPLSDNKSFFKLDMFKKMKPKAYLINTSRSGIIEKGALLTALKEGYIAGAAVDFIDDSDLLFYSKSHDNLILTNHQGGCTFEDMELTKNFIINKINNYIENYGV